MRDFRFKIGVLHHHHPIHKNLISKSSSPSTQPSFFLSFHPFFHPSSHLVHPHRRWSHPFFSPYTSVVHTDGDLNTPTSSTIKMKHPQTDVNDALLPQNACRHSTDPNIKTTVWKPSTSVAGENKDFLITPFNTLSNYRIQRYFSLTESTDNHSTNFYSTYLPRQQPQITSITFWWTDGAEILKSKNKIVIHLVWFVIGKDLDVW